MSRARHHKEHERKRARGGQVAYAGGDSNVMKEAKERKHGGRIKHEAEGEEAHERHDRERKRGGAVARKRGGRVHHGKHRRDGGPTGSEGEGHERNRARGGGIGSNERPLSTAARTSKLKGEGPVNHPSD